MLVCMLHVEKRISDLPFRASGFDHATFDRILVVPPANLVQILHDVHVVAMLVELRKLKYCAEQSELVITHPLFDDADGRGSDRV